MAPEDQPQYVTSPAIHQSPLASHVGLEVVALMKACSAEFGARFTLARLAEVRELPDSAGALGAGALGAGADVPPSASEQAYDGWAATDGDPGPLVRQDPAADATCREESSLIVWHLRIEQG